MEFALNRPRRPDDSCRRPRWGRLGWLVCLASPLAAEQTGRSKCRDMTRLVLIFMAGGCGSLLRYAVSGWTQNLSRGTFPLGTLVVNCIGCALIGFLATLFAGPLLLRDDYKVAILIGLL